MQTQFRHERVVTETSSGIPLGDLTGLPILRQYPEQHLDHEDNSSAPQSEPEQTTDTAKLDNTAQQENSAQENAPSVSSPAQLMTTADPASLDPASTATQKSGIDLAKLARGESVELAAGLVVKLEGAAAYSLTWTGAAVAGAPANTPMLKITLPFAELDAAKAALSADKLALQVARLSTLDFSDFDSTAPLKSAAILDILKGGATEVTASHLDGLISTESKLTLKADKISLSDSNLEGVALSLNCKTCELSELSCKNSSVTIFADAGRIEGGTFGGDVILGGNLGEMVVSKTTTLLCTAPKANLINVVWEGLGTDVDSQREFMTRNRGFSYRSDLASPLLIATGEKLTVEKYVESMAPKLAASTATAAVRPARQSLQPEKLERYLGKPAPKLINPSGSVATAPVNVGQGDAEVSNSGDAPAQTVAANLLERPQSSGGVTSEAFSAAKIEDQDLGPPPEFTVRESHLHSPGVLKAQAGRQPGWFARNEWLIGGGAVAFAIFAILAGLKLGGVSKQPRDLNDDKPVEPVPAQVNTPQPSSQPISLETTPQSPTTLPALSDPMTAAPTTRAMTPATETTLSTATLPQIPAAPASAPPADTTTATLTAEPAPIPVQPFAPQSPPPPAPSGGLQSSAFVPKKLLDAATPDVQDQPRRVAPGSGHSGASFVPPELLELASPRSPN